MTEAEAGDTILVDGKQAVLVAKLDTGELEVSVNGTLRKVSSDRVSWPGVGESDPDDAFRSLIQQFQAMIEKLQIDQGKAEERAKRRRTEIARLRKIVAMLKGPSAPMDAGAEGRRNASAFVLARESWMRERNLAKAQSG